MSKDMEVVTEQNARLLRQIPEESYINVEGSDKYDSRSYDRKDAEGNPRNESNLPGTLKKKKKRLAEEEKS